MLDEATKKPESKRFVQRHHDAGKALWLILQSSNRRAMAYRPVASASFGRAGKALEEMGRSVEEGAPWLVKLQKWLHGEPFHWMDEVQTWDTFTKRLPHYLAIAENPPQQELWGGEGS